MQCKNYILYDSDYTAFQKRQNYFYYDKNFRGRNCQELWERGMSRRTEDFQGSETSSCNTIKLAKKCIWVFPQDIMENLKQTFQPTQYNDGDISLYICPNLECTTRRVNSNVNYVLWMIIMVSVCSSIVTNVPLWQETMIVGEATNFCGQEGYGKLRTFIFAVNLKCLQKMRSVKNFLAQNFT